MDNLVSYIGKKTEKKRKKNETIFQRYWVEEPIHSEFVFDQNVLEYLYRGRRLGV